MPPTSIFWAVFLVLAIKAKWYKDIKIWLCNVQVGQHMVAGKLAGSCCCACSMHSILQLVFLPIHHMLTYLLIAQPDFDAFRPFFPFVYKFQSVPNLNIIMDIKKELVSITEEHSDCEIIEVVDLAVAAKKDAGQAMAEMWAHVSLKCILSCLVSTFCMSACLVCKFKF